MGLRVDILCNDGSPLGVTLSDLNGDNGRVGVGGAELALLTMCEAWAKRGDVVRLYNNPLHSNDVFQQLAISDFAPADDRDILIIFRSPNSQCFGAKGKKVWWSCDQYTVGSFKDFSIMVDEIVTISQFHNKYFKDVYNINNTTSIDLPVRSWEYVQDVRRVDGQLLFCSVPDRGLNELSMVWDRIKAAVPDASLAITSDYRLWGASYTGTEQYMMKFARKKDVSFRGAVRREELVKLQLQSDIHAYPCTYDELFCIACAECQVAGAYSVTSDVGALATTNMGMLIHGNPNTDEWKNLFVDRIIMLLQNRGDLELLRWQNQERAKKRFSIDNILRQWDTKVFDG